MAAGAALEQAGALPETGLHTMQGISDKLRDLTHYDHGASAVNQALHVIHDALQGPHAIMYLYRLLHAL